MSRLDNEHDICQVCFAETKMDLTGRHLGKYELLERVGRGGMAYVYKAYQPTVDRNVAVKVLHSHLAEDGQFLARFKREAKGLGSLRHPHIVSVIDFDVDEGWYYMVMDFIQGETLEEILSRRGRLAVDGALRLTAQLAGALDYAHRHGRIHRDIKPSNVMFADDSQQHAVITDFGLTRLLDNATITLSGTISGTPAYMSPEAAQGEKVDARADIYSLGVVLYEMVTGQRPYAGETPLSVIMKLVLEPLPPALSINPQLPPAVGQILHKATAKAPDERYQTAAEMLEAVQAEIGDGGLEAGSLVGGEEGQTELLTPPRDVESTAAAVTPGEPAANGKEEAARSRWRWLPILTTVALMALTLVVGFIILNGSMGDAANVAALPTAAVIGGEATPAETATPEATATETAGPDGAWSQPAGSLRFAEADDNNLRQYSLLLDDVPTPPSGFHYELWFDFAGRPAPENVAEVTAENGRISYTDVLVNNLAESVSGVRVSLEPDFDDDPTISADVVYTGAVDAARGLAEIEMLATGSQP